MTLHADTLTDISRAVVLEFGHALNLVGVTASDGGSERVELLITIEDGGDAACRRLVNLSRAEPDAFERDLRAKLRSVLRAHQAAR